MAGDGDGSSRSLEDTPTWAVAAVCLILVIISIIIEHAIEMLDKWLKKRHKSALSEALEKIKSELMLLGFISLLLTVGQGVISKTCVPVSVGNSWHPCNHHEEQSEDLDDDDDDDNTVGRKLLQSTEFIGVTRRILAGGGSDECAAKGKVPLISSDAIHQLHIFIFVLAVSHILYCIITMALGRLKI